MGKGRQARFFEKKRGRPPSKKRLVLGALATAAPGPAIAKFFLLLFCSQKRSACFLSLVDKPTKL
jgi:hypothetical protein